VQTPDIPPARPEPENATPAAATTARPAAPPNAPNKVTLNAGLIIPVRLVDGLSSERNQPGDTFTAALDKELAADGFVIAERGARVEGRVVAADRGGKLSGVASLAVAITWIQTSDGQVVAVQTDPFARHAGRNHAQDAEMVGGGAAIGAGVGAGAGAGAVMLTRGQPATLPSETRLAFRLRAPVTITERAER